MLLVDPQRYDQLVECSLLMGHRTAATADQKESLRALEIQFLSSMIDAVVVKKIEVEPELSPGLSAFELKIPSVKFQGFDRILVVVLSTQQRVDARVLDWISALSGWKVALVLLSQHGDLLRDALRNVSFNIALIDDENLKSILLAASPREMFLDLLFAQVNLATLSPFQCYGPVMETFYGRAQERQKIVNSIRHAGNVNYAVIGPRKIGKTSLLLRVKQDIDGSGSLRSIFLDLSPYDDATAAFQAILDALQIPSAYSSADAFIRQIGSYCRAQNRQLALVIDEVDGVLNSDQKTGGVFTKTLRTLTNQLGIKVVLAGYESIYLQMHDPSTVMFNTFTPLELRALDKGDAMALIEESFRNVIRIERSGMMHILDQTACYPNFIQFCCQQLLEEPHVQTSRAIERSDVNRVLSSPRLYDYMARVYIESLDQRCKLLLYLMVACYDERLASIIIDRKAYHDVINNSLGRKSESHNARQSARYSLGDTFTPYDLHRLLELHHVSLSDDELAGLMRRLALASIVKHAEGRNYSFVLPHLPQILAANAEVELSATNLLEKIGEIFRKTG